MLRKPLNDIKDNILREHFNFLQQESQGKIIELGAAPTAGAPLLQDYEWGVYSNVLYQRVGNSIYSYTPTAVITVT
jgi:hypothetical protein